MKRLMTNPLNGRSPRTRVRGLTLLELLLALAITAIVGLAMSTAMTATARGMTNAGDMRSALQRANVAYMRLRDFTTRSKALLQVDPNSGFVLWDNDENPGARVNLSEIRVFWYDAALGQMSVEWLTMPEGWTQEMKDDYDQEFSPGQNFMAVMNDERALGNTQSEMITDGLAGWAVEFEGSDPQLESRFRVRLTVQTSDGATSPVMMTFGLINHMVPR